MCSAIYRLWKMGLDALLVIATQRVCCRCGACGLNRVILVETVEQQGISWLFSQHLERNLDSWNQERERSRATPRALYQWTKAMVAELQTGDTS